METYSQFINRINSFEKKRIDYGTGYFKSAPSVASKVDKDNKFKSFYGDTVVFELSDNVKAELSEYTDILYNVAPECFCERLGPATLHVTLHDLSNSPTLKDIAEELFYNELKITEKLAELNKYKNTSIRMKSKYIFNMVNTSLVMGLYPADECEYKKLMCLYEVFDGIKKLIYPLTPHITLAYYNVNGFDSRSSIALADTVEKLNNKRLETELNTCDLYYQKFTSMNDYINIIALG